MIRSLPERRRPAPHRPVLTFQVGACGHRHLPEADLDGTRLAAVALFRALRAQAVAVHAADQAEPVPLYLAAPPRLRCVCGLAEGADSILAEAALEDGWELVAVLPFAPDEFAKDLNGAALDRHRSLLARAAVVCALDGTREEGSDGTAYGEVAQVLVEQSDLLLAVWDGKPARGPGGTEDVVQRSLRSGLPVAVLPTSGPARVTWLDATDGDCATILRSAVLPPAADAAMARSYFADSSRPPAWARASLRAYEAMVTLGLPVSKTPAPPGPAAASGAAGALDPAFLPADRLATEHAARYRAAGLMRYGLILPATLASLLGWYGEGWMQPAGNLADFAILAFLLHFSARGWWGPALRRFIAYRALAESLRNARLLAGLGAVAQSPGAAAHEQRSADWTAWYGRAVTREQGMAQREFGPASVAAARETVRSEALGQVAFLLARAARFDAIAGRLRRIGVALFLCGGAFSAVRAALLLASAGSTALRDFNELALVLPAMAPVFLGLLSFNEYGKLATRYRAVAAMLGVQVAALDAAPPRRAAVLAVARRIADIMLAEGAEWRELTRARTVSAY